MLVYVDNARHSFGRMTLCHLMGDTADELHSMADKIGMERRWFQNRRVPHYDICLKQKALAIRAGVIEIDRKQTVELIHKHGWLNKKTKKRSRPESK